MSSKRDLRSPEAGGAEAGCARTLVAACGNVQAGDDALGPLVARKLRRLAPPGVGIVDLDIRPAGLLDHLVTPIDELIVVDAVTIDGASCGSIIDVDWRSPDRPRLIHDDVLSSHGLSIAHQIDLAEKLGMLPHSVRLIGAIIESPRVGDRAGKATIRAIDNVVERVISRLGQHSCAGVGYA